MKFISENDSKKDYTKYLEMKPEDRKKEIKLLEEKAMKQKEIILKMKEN